MMRNAISAEEYRERKPYRTKEGYMIEQIVFQKHPVVINFDRIADSVIAICKKEMKKWPK